MRPTVAKIRRWVRLSDHEVADTDPSLLTQVKRQLAQIDAMPDVDRAALVAGLDPDEQRLFQGGVTDQERMRYRRLRADLLSLEALRDDLAAVLS